MANRTLWTGWWGIISFFFNIGYALGNAAALLRLGTLKKPRGGFGTLDPGRPMLLRSGVLVLAVFVAIGTSIAVSSNKNQTYASNRYPATTIQATTTSEPTSPTAAATLLNKALQEQVSGNTSQAEKDFTEVVRLDPRNKFGYYNLGLIAQIAGNGADAETEYRLALAIDLNYTPALYNFGILRAQDGATADAIALYRRAISSDPKFADGYFNLGLLLRASGQTAAGNAEVQTAVKLDPSLTAKAQAQGVPLRGD
jgi:tetratricopeptide (TPR) repeat protein